MQIEITFTCRECEAENTLHTDTSNYGVLGESFDAASAMDINTIGPATTLDLSCGCGHVSGIIALGYRFLQEHRPSIDR